MSVQIMDDYELVNLDSLDIKYDSTILNHDSFQNDLTSDMIMQVIDNMVDLELCDNNNWKLVHYICKYGTWSNIMHIISKNCKLDDFTSEGDQPIHLIVQHNSVDDNMVNLLTILVKKGVKLDVCNYIGYSPLYYLCTKYYGGFFNYDESLCKILDLYTSLNIPVNEKYDNWTVLQFMCCLTDSLAPKSIAKLLRIDQTVYENKYTDPIWQILNGNNTYLKQYVIQENLVPAQ